MWDRKTQTTLCTMQNLIYTRKHTHANMSVWRPEIHFHSMRIWYMLTKLIFHRTPVHTHRLTFPTLTLYKHTTSLLCPWRWPVAYTACVCFYVSCAPGHVITLTSFKTYTHTQTTDPHPSFPQATGHSQRLLLWRLYCTHTQAHTMPCTHKLIHQCEDVISSRWDCQDNNLLRGAESGWAGDNLIR